VGGNIWKELVKKHVKATDFKGFPKAPETGRIQTTAARWPFYSSAAWCLLALSGLAFARGEGLAGVILGMLSVLRWLWVTRPIPNPYESRPYDPNSPDEGF
jgi:hypothetical protein